jgi:beta-glucuronidase
MELCGGLVRHPPPVYIEDWIARLAKDGGIEADVFVASAAGGCTAGAVRLAIPELGIQAVQDGKVSFTIKTKPERWIPESCKLYSVAISFTPTGGVNGDTVRDCIGFREIVVRGAEIFLNGKKFLKRVCVHEGRFVLEKTTSEEIIRHTIRGLKAMNGYYLRLAHYIPTIPVLPKSPMRRGAALGRSSRILGGGF